MIAAHLWPRCVLSLESPDESKAAAYATLIVIVIASGVFGYYGAAGLLWMIPESWGGVNDDGVWMSVRNYIAGSAAIVFSVWFHTTMFRFARQSVERDRLAFIAEEQKALIGASQSTLQSKMQQYEDFARGNLQRSEEHTSELQSLMRISYAVFCLKKKKIKT